MVGRLTRFALPLTLSPRKYQENVVLFGARIHPWGRGRYFHALLFGFCVLVQIVGLKSDGTPSSVPSVPILGHSAAWLVAALVAAVRQRLLQDASPVCKYLSARTDCGTAVCCSLATADFIIHSSLLTVQFVCLHLNV